MIESPSALRARMATVYSELGVPASLVESQLPTEADIAALIEISGQPRRILDVGSGIGARAALLAMAFPGVRVIGVDPDLPLTTLNPDLRIRGIEGEPTTLALARAASERLRIADRMRFVAGGFAESATTRSALDEGRPRARVVGPQISSEERPLDLIFVGGLTSAEARAADIRLAASALAPEGVIACNGMVGSAGASVRAGAFEFLRYYPEYHLVHGAHASDRSTLGFLRHRSAGWFKGFPQASPPAGTSTEIRERLADLTALTFGERPILEVAIGTPVLGADFRSRGLASRTLRLNATDWTTHFFDPVIDQIFSALAQTPDSVLFSADILDYAPDEFVGRLFSRLADRKTQALIFATPPGEVGVAGLHSRPAARIIDLAASQHLGVYAPARLEFERARHGLRDAPTAFGSTSRHASLFLFGQPGGVRDARDRSLMELAPFAASVHEQVELQRIYDDAAVRRNLTAESDRRAKAEGDRERYRVDFEAARTEVDAIREHSDSMISALQAEVARLSQEVRLAKEAEAGMRGDVSRISQDFSARTKEIETEAGALRREVIAAKAEVARLQQANALLETKKTDAETAARDAIVRRQEIESDLNRRLDETMLGFASAREGFHSGLERLNSRFETVTQLESVAAEGWRSEKELHLREIASLREAEKALLARLQELQARVTDREAEIARVTEARDKVQRELESLRADFRSATAAHGREKEALEGQRTALESERSALQARLNKESMELVNATMREADARVRLTGLASHIGVMQDMLAEFRRSPFRFDASKIAYTSRPVEARGPHEVPAAVVKLHGEAADLSNELARELEAMAARNASFESWKSEYEELNLRAHEKGLEAERAGIVSLVESDRMVFDNALLRLRRQEHLIDRLETLLFPEDHPERPLRPQDSRRDGDAETPTTTLLVQELRMQENRLAHLAQAIEADKAMADLESFDDEDIEETESASEGRGEATSRPFDEPAAKAAAGASLIVETAPASSPAEETVPTPAIPEVVEVAPPRPQESATPEPAPPEPAPPATARAAETRSADPGAADRPSPRPDAFASRRGWPSRLWAWIRTYGETTRLVELQNRLSGTLGPRGVLARVFDPDYYRTQGSLDGHGEALQHYLLIGERLGRSPLIGFDPAYYGRAIRGRGGVSGSLLRHFLTTGIEKAIPPSERLSRLYDDARAAQMTPLEFYFRWVEVERRKLPAAPIVEPVRSGRADDAGP